jgi:hypothetical protein
MAMAEDAMHAIENATANCRITPRAVGFMHTRTEIMDRFWFFAGLKVYNNIRVDTLHQILLTFYIKLSKI